MYKYIQSFNLVLFMVVFNGILASTVNKEHFKCGYDSCTKPKQGYLNVHMVSHTHNDAGWLKTFDQYFYGTKNEIQWAGVNYIIDSVIDSLWYNPHRKFIYVETSFFWKWWLKQGKSVQNKVRKLVNEGRLEFVSGGWTMHDEATTHYQSIVDQMSWGFRRLNDTFGKCGQPRVGWQIDPFGHSRESASIMARFGFDGLLFGRLDYQEQLLRKYYKKLEMIWETSSNLGNKADLFTSILYNQYSAPEWFCFDILCGDPPIIDDANSPDYNADERAADFVNYLKNVTKVYTSNNILITMGGDFTYQGGDVYFLNLDKLMRAVNNLKQNGTKMNLFYSTPSCYLKAVNDEQLTYTTKNDDFFPYGSEAHAYWTGYYTSRPALKYYERMGNNYLQVCKQLFALSNIDGNQLSKLNTMREAMGLLQHHDAVTGTEKQHVAFDYARILNNGFTECGDITDAALRKLMVKDKAEILKTEDPLLESCLLLNISTCDVTEKFSTFVVTLYNPLSRVVTYYVRLPVVTNGDSYEVFDPSGDTVATQIVPIPDSVQNIPGRSSNATEEILFLAEGLPPLGYKSYYVSAVNYNDQHNVITKRRRSHSQRSIQTYNSEADSIDVGNVSVKQSFWKYNSYDGNNMEVNNQSSGAYIFRPNGSAKKIQRKFKSKTYKGPIVDEVHQVFNDWVSQVIRKYHDRSYIEFQWLIGPISIHNNGKEIVTRYTFDPIKSNSIFYTDSNGREMLQRVRDQRPTFNASLEEPVAGNYYPITTRIMMKDNVDQVSVITDRAQGGSSIHDGELELMLHRRILQDDNFGVDEALNETAFGEGLVVRGTHYITSGNPTNQTALDRMLVQQRVLSPWTFFTRTTKTLDEWRSQYNMEYSGLKKALPPNVQIMTLEPWSDNSYLIRLEHIMEKNDDPLLSKPATVNLKNIFVPFEIISAEESTLGGNQWLKDMKRLVWKKNSRKISDSANREDLELENIKLKAMDIRSFIVKLQFKNTEL